MRLGDVIEGFRIDGISMHEMTATHRSGAKIELRLFRVAEERPNVPVNVK